MRLQPAALGPPVGIIVAVHIAENDVLPGAVQYDTQIKVHPGRPKAKVLGAGHTVQAEARIGDVGLQVKSSGLSRPLLFVGEAGEAGSERVGYAELHVSSFESPNASSSKSKIT